MYQKRVPLMILLRRPGRSGQGRRHQARRAGARRPRLHHLPLPGAHQGRAAAPAPVALLDAPAEGGSRGHLRPHLVRPRARRARRRASPARPSGPAPTTRSTSSSATWSAGAPSSSSSGSTSAPTPSWSASRPASRIPTSSGRSPRRTGATATSSRSTRARHRGHVPPHVHRVRAVDRPRERRQDVRAHQSPTDHQRRARSPLARKLGAVYYCPTARLLARKDAYGTPFGASEKKGT